jgi:hypothetical protein
MSFTMVDIKYTFALSQRDAPELCVYFFRPTKGARNAGCPLHLGNDP